MFGIDYAWGRPSTRALKKAGVKFVCRYVSYPGNSKNITRDEADRLRKAGIDIVIVFETTEGRALSGYNEGRYDAIRAQQQVVAAGGPFHGVIYFAVDFDASTSSERAQILDYFRGCASVLGADKVGIYGGVLPVGWVLDAGYAHYGWQTYAWQYRNRERPWDPRAQLQQYDNGNRLDGVSVDYNRALADDFGQWEKPKPKPPRKGLLPGPSPKPKWFWLAVKELRRRALRRA